MLCKNYEQLGHFDKVLYIGELLHACQSDDDFFNMGKTIIESAKKCGVFEGVTILPDILKKSENEKIEQERTAN